MSLAAFMMYVVGPAILGGLIGTAIAAFIGTWMIDR